MADGSAIEWTDATWNPVTGCTKITPRMRQLLRCSVFASGFAACRAIPSKAALI